MDQLQPDSSTIRTAHVLCMDLVGYSRLPIEEQTRCVTDLQDLVRALPPFQAARESGDLLCLPTGDGVVLAFLRDPLAPVWCAIELGRALPGYPHLRLRQGIHSGPVYLVQDINGRLNIAGAGVNTAQRVMDCGDAGHILLSSAAARHLPDDEARWLHELDEIEIQGGERLRVCNCFTREFGNPELPRRWLTQFADSTPGNGDVAARPPLETAPVALLYKQGAQPDEQLLQLLERRLTTSGYQVFVDRDPNMGLEWVREMERRLTSAQAVIPLLSETSLHSEMLERELEIASEAARFQQGRPRILPVRVNYRGPWPDPLGDILDQVACVPWKGPQDNDQVVQDLLERLGESLEERPSSRRRPVDSPVLPQVLESVGGAVPLGSPFYIVRSTDAEFLSAVSARDSIVLLKGPRQMGKTSLLARGLQQARREGARVALTDFQAINAAHFESVDSFLRALAESLADQLDLEVFPDEVWNPRRSPNVNFERYLRNHVLEAMPNSLVWGLDEVDRLFHCDFGGEVFGLFRSWHNQRSLQPDGPWSRVTLAIAYATEAHLFIRDLNQSPFNIGTRLLLNDFGLEQVADLNRRYGSPLTGRDEVASYFGLIGGHPYLAQRGLYEMVTHGLGLVRLQAEVDEDGGPFEDHLRRLLVLLAQDDQLCEEIRSLLGGRSRLSYDSFYRLRSAGLIAGESPHDVRLRCRLYQNYLEQHVL